MPAIMTKGYSQVYHTENGRRIARVTFNLTGLTGGNDTVAFPNPLPSPPLAVSYEGTAGSPACSWQAADANNLYVVCAGATANATVTYAVG